MGSIVSREELVRIVEVLKKQGKKIVTTNGSFDLMHVGHARALQAAKVCGDVLIVGVNTDSSIKQYKGDKRPVIGEQDRAEMLAALACVDYVTLFTEREPSNFLTLVKPNVHVKSGDYSLSAKPGEKGYLFEAEAVRKHGGEIKIMPLVAGKSTTNIIERIREVYGPEAH